MSLNQIRHITVATILYFLIFAMPLSYAADFTQTVSAIKPTVVAIGGFDKTRSPPLTFAGTGFVVDDGLTVITNAHVVRAMITAQMESTIGIVIVKGQSTEFRHAALLRIDAEHDLALLKMDGAPLPAMPLGNAANVKEGQSVAFTGFPLGMQIGLRHVTHRAMVSSITPIVIPAPDSKRLDAKTISQLRKSSFDVFQLDGTAYPGNSGSPVYDTQTGAAIGVINMVYVKGLKETAISDPSGIAYAIPISYVHDLLARKP